MAVRTRKRGKTWSYSFDIEPDSNGKRRMKEKGGFATKEEAFSAGASAYTDWKNGNIGLTSEKILLQDYLNRWMEVHSINLKRTSIVVYRTAINNIIRYIGNIPLQSLRPRDVDIFLRNLYEKESMSYATIRSIKTVLHLALQYAIYPLELIAYNACDSVKIPKKAIRQVVKRHVISSEKLEELLTKSPFGTPYHIPIVLAYYTGLRIGELLGLTWDDLDLENGSLSVTKQITPINKTSLYYSEPKTESSKRTIILDSTTLSILRKWKKLQTEQEISLGTQYVCTYVSDDNKIILCSKGITPPDTCRLVKPICTRMNGKLIYRTAFIHHLKANGVNSHSFRHTHATRLIESQASPKSVASRLGHKSTAITEDLYTHNTIGMQKQIADITEQMHRNDVGKPTM